MPDFWKVVNKVIDEADILLLVLDAREIEKTRNKEIEDKVKRAEKRLIYVINKSDLVDVDKVKQFKRNLRPAVFISAKDHLGTKVLRELILKNSGSSKKIYVGVLGYPNTGKSTLINALAGSNRASTSSESGHTKGKQHVRISQRMKMIDTPGVIPYKEKDNTKFGITGSVDFSKIKDPEDVVYNIIRDNPGLLEEYYNVESSDDPDDVIEEISIKLNCIKKGKQADPDKACRIILKDWQQGKIHREI